MKFPFLIESRRFLFGLIEVTQWGWRCGLTKPQIDLLLHDQPFIDYKKVKDKDKSNVSQNKAAEAQRRLEENRRNGTDTLDLSQFNFTSGKADKL